MDDQNPYLLSSSYSIYDVFLMECQADSINKFQQSFELIESEKKRLMELLKKRCKETAKFFGRNFYADETRAGCRLDLGGDRCRQYSCAADIMLPDQSFFAICFGKFDILGIQGFPHSYWTNYFVARLLASGKFFSDIAIVPTQQIEWDRETLATGEVRSPSKVGPLDSPFVAFTLLKPIKWADVQDPPMKRLVIDRANELRDHFNQHSVVRADFFLTYSTRYPLAVKAEFKSFKDVKPYFQALRSKRPWLEETSSIFGFRYEDYQSDYVHKINGHDVPILFTLLLKLKAKNDKRIINRISSILTENKFSPIDKRTGITYRGHYWDVQISIETAAVAKLIKTVIEKIKSHQSVLNVITIPQWT